MAKQPPQDHLAGNNIVAMPEAPKPQDHGRLVAPPSTRKPVPYIPPELRRKVLDYNLPAVEAAAKYHWWKLKILRPIRVAGKVVQPGDTVEVDGATACDLVLNFQAEFIDSRRGKLEAAKAELEKLNAPLNRRALTEDK